MKHLSLKLLSETVISRRKTMGLSQAALSKKANINRSILSRLETGGYRYRNIPYVFLEDQNWLKKGFQFISRKMKASH